MGVSRLLVYAGEGSSHSWTWLADLLESANLFDVRFLGADALAEHLSVGPAAVVVSGGDGFQIARAFSQRVFAQLGEYIRRGGRYIGICAGAYLPLPSSLTPFNKFNISTTRIENLSRTGVLNPVSPRWAVSYGSCSIIHPVRGEVRVSSSTGEFLAPIYGGPVFKEPEKDAVLLRYSGFTERTEFQTGFEAVRETVLGRPAAVLCRHGQGELLLFGPHLEHPHYPAANSLFLSIIGMSARVLPSACPRFRPVSKKEVSSAVSALKVAVLGLENRSFVVGNKLWDGSRFLELIRAIETRCHSLDGGLSARVASLIWRMRDEMMSADGTFDHADECPGLLVEAARLTVDGHFQALRRKEMGL